VSSVQRSVKKFMSSQAQKGVSASAVEIVEKAKAVEDV